MLIVYGLATALAAMTLGSVITDAYGHVQRERHYHRRLGAAFDRHQALQGQGTGSGRLLAPRGRIDGRWV